MSVRERLSAVSQIAAILDEWEMGDVRVIINTIDALFQNIEDSDDDDPDDPDEKPEEEGEDGPIEPTEIHCLKLAV